MPEERRFVFAPLERRGLIAGLSGAQLGMVGGGLLVGTAILRIAPGLVGVLLGVAIVIGCTGLAFVPIQGRSVDAWAPTVVRRSARVVAGRHRTRPSGAALVHGSLPVPAAFAGLDFDELQVPGEPGVGVVRDLRAATLTAVIAVRGQSFALLDGADKCRHLDAWSAVLAGLSREGGPIRSLQWVERIVPGDAEGLRRHFDSARRVSAESAAGRSYADLVAGAGPLDQDHECFVALTIGTKPGRNVEPGPILLRELALLRRQLRAAEVEVSHVLGLGALGAVVRTAFDPVARAGLERRRALFGDLEGCAIGTAWPSACDESWASLRTDAQWHATFWIADWPRREVGPDFLAPLLLRATCQRSVAVIMAPLPPGAGVREAEAARTAQAADDELRSRAGFLATARRRREAEGIARREAELSDGHAAFCFSGYVTVSAGDPEALEAACGEIVQAGHQCRVEMRRLCGIQDLAFSWTLPLGRGIR